MAVVQPADREAPGRASPGAAPAASVPELAAVAREHQAMLWRYLRLLGADGHEADDLMQETFAQTAERLRRGDVVHAPEAFLRGVARNLLLAARRRSSNAPPTVQWCDAVDAAVQEDVRLLDDRRVAALRECVGRLQGRMREAVERHHLAGASYEETARTLGIGMHGIKSLLRRARHALRDCVENRMREEASS